MREFKRSGIKNNMKGPLNSVTYTITNERIIIGWGLVGKQLEEIELIRIEDVSIRQSLSERIQGIGQVFITSKDKTTPLIKLQDVEEPQIVKEIIRKANLELFGL